MQAYNTYKATGALVASIEVLNMVYVLSNTYEITVPLSAYDATDANVKTSGKDLLEMLADKLVILYYNYVKFTQVPFSL